MANVDEDVMEGVEQGEDILHNSNSDQDVENNGNMESTAVLPKDKKRDSGTMELQRDEKIESDWTLLEANLHKLQIEEHAKIIQRQCREQKRGYYAQMRTITEQGVQMGWLEQSEEDRQERRILEEARARNEIRPLPTPSWHTEATQTLYGGRRHSTIDDEWADKVYKSLIEDFYKSLTKPFKKWVIHAINEGIWIKPVQLPLAFKFAMRRPHMSDSTFQSTLRSMGLHDGFEFGRAPGLDTSRSYDHGHIVKDLPKGNDSDLSMQYSRGMMESSPSRDGRPTGIREDVAEKGLLNTIESDDTTREGKSNYHMLTLYRQIQEGKIDLEEAPSRYGSALDMPGVDNDVLIDALQELHIPNHQIPSKGRLATRGPQIGNGYDPSISHGSGTFADDLFNDEQLGPILGRILKIAEMYRCSSLTHENACVMIYDCLDGNLSKPEMIEDSLKDISKTPKQIALLIYDAWEDDMLGDEDACEERIHVNRSVRTEEEFARPKKRPVMPKPLAARKDKAIDDISLSAIDYADAKDTIETLELLIKLSRSKEIGFEEAYDRIRFSLQDYSLEPEIITGTMQASSIIPSDAAELLWTVAFTNGPSHKADSLRQQQEKTKEVSSVADGAYKLKNQEFGPANTPANIHLKSKETMLTGRGFSHSLRSPSVNQLALASREEPEEGRQRSGTPFVAPTPPTAIGYENQNRQPSAIRPGPTSAARSDSWRDPKILVKTCWDGTVSDKERAPSPEDGITDDLYGLPMSTKKARELGHATGLSADYLKDSIRTRFIPKKLEKTIASDPVCLKSSKRKASTTMRSPSPTKSLKSDHFDSLARPGETRKECVESRSASDLTPRRKHLCPFCSQSPCECRHSHSEGWCPMCEAIPCARMHEGQSLEYDHTGHPDMVLFPDLPILDSRTRLFKTSNTVVAFLCSYTRDDNIYHKIIGLEKLPLELGIIHSAHVMLKDIEQAVSSGRINGPRGAKDKQVITVLRRIRGSLKTLQESNERNATSQAGARLPANPVSSTNSQSMQSQQSVSVISHLRCLTNNAAIFTELGQWGRSPVTDAVYKTVRSMYDHIEEGIQSTHIRVQGFDDNVAMSTMQRIIDEYDGDENISSIRVVQRLVTPQGAATSALLSYLAGVMDYENPLSILEDIVLDPDSDGNIRNLSLITDHIEKGIKSGELAENPAKEGVDGRIQAVIEDLQNAATPLQARTNSISALPTPKKDVLNLGCTSQKSDDEQNLQSSSQPAIPRKQPKSICSAYEHLDYYGQETQSALPLSVEGANNLAGSKERISQELPEISIINQDIKPKIDLTKSNADCIACSRNVDSDDLVSLCCKHSMCRPCIEALTRESLEEADRFPPSHCNTSITLKAIFYSVPSDLFTRFRKRQVMIDWGVFYADEDNSESTLADQRIPILRKQGRDEGSNTPAISLKPEPTMVPIPTTPRPKPKELPKSMDDVARPPAPGLRRLRDRSPPSPRKHKSPKEGPKMTANAALEYYKDLALQRQVPLTSILNDLRATRARSDRENQEIKANLTWDALRFFSNPNTSSTVTSSAAVSKMFDKYRENPREEPDKIGVEGSIKYLQDLSVKLDEVVVLAVLTELDAPTMGEFARDGFVDGWLKNRAETITKQQAHVTHWRNSLSQMPDFFRRVYKSTFLLARQPGQKVLPLDTAIEYWRLLFSAPGLSWTSSSTPWLDWWIEYLESNWKKSISKDMWDQTLSFVLKSREDETMSWWSEDGAWPGVLDEFVMYVRQKKGGTETEMDIG